MPQPINHPSQADLEAARQRVADEVEWLESISKDLRARGVLSLRPFLRTVDKAHRAMRDLDDSLRAAVKNKTIGGNARSSPQPPRRTSRSLPIRKRSRRASRRATAASSR